VLPLLPFSSPRTSSHYQRADAESRMIMESIDDDKSVSRTLFRAAKKVPFLR
jgi:hypothetical protein